MTDDSTRYHEFVVVYVDDELQSLKYFPKLFPEFRVLTAANASEAQVLLDSLGETVAIVMSDQRMPGGSGTDLLAGLHRRRPDVIRILTTAHSDLESAIAAVNTGAVYRYVVKPWQVEDLRQTLRRGYELFVLQRERNRLLREKLAVLQRMFIMDRVRSYAVLAAGLAGRVKYSLQALKAFLDAAPIPEPDSAMIADGDVRWHQLWDLARAESQRMLDTIQGVAERTITPAYHFAPLDAARAIREGVAAGEGLATARGVVVLWDPVPDGIPLLSADQGMLARMAGIMLDRLLLVDPLARQVRIRLARSEVWGSPALRVSVTAEQRDWTELELHGCFAMLSGQSSGSAHQDGDLLAAYFIAYHHGGTMAVHRTSPHGPGFVACLPFDPLGVAIPGVDADWLERTFTWFEG